MEIGASSETDTPRRPGRGATSVDVASLANAIVRARLRRSREKRSGAGIVFRGEEYNIAVSSFARGRYHSSSIRFLASVQLSVEERWCVTEGRGGGGAEKERKSGER